MTSEQRNALTTPIKLALGAALGIVGSVVMFTWSASAACLAGLIQRVKAGAIPAGSVIAATMTGHGLKDPDTAIKTAGFEPIIVPPTKEAVMKVIGL